MKVAAIAVTVLLAGCATAPEIISSNPVAVIVKAPTMKEAAAAAEVECLKNGKHARTDGMEAAEFGKTILRATCM